MGKISDDGTLIVERTFEYAYYSHHKCATGWTNSILRELCFHLGLKHRTAHGSVQYEKYGGLRAWVEAQGIECLAFTNAEIEEAERLPSHQGFHVVRDPRDVLVSGYFSHKNSHPTDNWPELEEHRAALQSLSKEGGLLKEIEFSQPFLSAMRDWDYDQEHILELKMENLTSDPHVQFRRVLRHLGLYEMDALKQPGLLQKSRHYSNRIVYKLHHELPLPLPRRLSRESTVHGDVLDAILEAHRFEKLTGGRSQGEADPESHYRKGKPGDWENHFTDRVSKAFEDAYGDIVDTLGYGEIAEESATGHQRF